MDSICERLRWSDHSKTETPKETMLTGTDSGPNENWQVDHSQGSAGVVQVSFLLESLLRNKLGRNGANITATKIGVIGNKKFTFMLKISS